MSRCYPTIDSPCQKLPANPDNRAEVWCGLCRKTVHNLSALTEAAQAELLSRPGELCVSYRRTRLPLLAGAAMLLAAQGVALAQDVADPSAELEQVEVVGGGIRPPPPPAYESVFLESEVPEAVNLPTEQARTPRPGDVPAQGG